MASAQIIVRGVLYDDETGSPGARHRHARRSDQGYARRVQPDRFARAVLAAGGERRLSDRRDSPRLYVGAVGAGSVRERRAADDPDSDRRERRSAASHRRRRAAQGRSELARRRSTATVGRARTTDSRAVVRSGRAFSSIGRDLEKANVATLGEFLQGVPGLSVLNPRRPRAMQMTRGRRAPACVECG